MTDPTVPAAPAVSAELGRALLEVGAAADLDPVVLGQLVADALVQSYRRSVRDDEGIGADVNLTSGRFELFSREPGGEVVSLGPPSNDVARGAAQIVRYAVSGRRREVEKDRLLADALEHRGELVDAIVEGRQGRGWLLRTPDMFATLPQEETIPGELFQPGAHVKAVVIDGRRRAQDAVMVLSRSHPLLIRLLMAREVPELQSGQVVIRAVAREAGRRTKVAVDAPDGDIDPRGACIGPRGVRHRSVVAELGGSEQLQVVTWSPDPAAYVAQALSPATVLGVSLDVTARTAQVTVDPGQLSLAIGRGGENARLAARLTGWRIDISGAE